MKCNLALQRFCPALAQKLQRDTDPTATKGLVAVTVHHRVFKDRVIARCVAYRNGNDLKQHALELCPWCGAKLGVYQPRSSAVTLAKLERDGGSESAVSAPAATAPDAHGETP